jgi:MFS family permease
LASIRFYSTGEQPKAIGIFSSVFGLASVVGQLLGGLLLSIHWKDFPGNGVSCECSVTLICILGIHFTMDNEHGEEKGIDFTGSLLSYCSALSICPLIFGQKYEWAWYIFGSMLIGIFY